MRNMRRERGGTSRRLPILRGSASGKPLHRHLLLLAVRLEEHPLLVFHLLLRRAARDVQAVLLREEALGDLIVAKPCQLNNLLHRVALGHLPHGQPAPP
eukprot:717224-Pyramimonas_sp.AAC.2